MLRSLVKVLSQETLNLNQLTGYQTGGTIHIIANNMIGFTTESVDSRSTKYASDLQKVLKFQLFMSMRMIQKPV